MPKPEVRRFASSNYILHPLGGALVSWMTEFWRSRRILVPASGGLHSFATEGPTAKCRCDTARRDFEERLEDGGADATGTRPRDGMRVCAPAKSCIHLVAGERMSKVLVIGSINMDLVVETGTFPRGRAKPCLARRPGFECRTRAWARFRLRDRWQSRRQGRGSAACRLRPR